MRSARKEVLPVKFVPHDYQRYAIDFIQNNPEAAVLLDMGLG